MEFNLGTERYLRTSSSKIVWESLEGETIVINLDTGAYYSLVGFSSCLWELLAAGVSIEGVCRWCERTAVEPAEAMPSEICQFVDALVVEGLLCVSQSGALHEPPSLVPDVPGLIRYSPPAFHKFTDMEALLLADPIHEIYPDDTSA